MQRHTMSDVIGDPQMYNRGGNINNNNNNNMGGAQDSFPEEPWEEEAEEEEDMGELSYELFQPPPEEEKSFGTIIRDTFGFYEKIAPDDVVVDMPQVCAKNVVHRYTFCNSNGLVIQVITLGATITSIRMPDNRSIMSDVLLGFDTLEEYETDSPEKNELRLGSTFGRFSSFISTAQIKIGREDFALSANVKGLHHEKGGFSGFDKVLWQSHVAHDRVIMSHVSPDGDEGYPGTVMVQMSFQLTADNRFIVKTSATTSKPTILSLAHNLFFNLAGHESGADGLSQHSLLVNADRVVKIDKFHKRPTGVLEEVGSSYYDLRVPRPIWKAIKKIPGGGYDHTFCLTKGYPTRSVSFACRLIHPNSGRYLEILSDMPGLYINTGTKLPNPEALPPLEPQSGFSEDFYPQFCREEKKQNEYAAELQKRMAAKQTWPREDIPEVDPEVLEALGDEVKPNDQYEGTKEPEENIVEPKETDEEKEEYVEDEDEQNGYKFLKDEAESEEEEVAVPTWTPPRPIIGKKGAEYKLNGAVCLIPQEYPDCMLYHTFPKPVLRPGDNFSRTTIYKFGVIPPRPESDIVSYL